VNANNQKEVEVDPISTRNTTMIAAGGRKAPRLQQNENNLKTSDEEQFAMESDLKTLRTKTI
jgi:hypothetical protein